MRYVAAAETQDAGSGLEQADHGPRKRALAAAGLADDSERLALTQGDRYVVDRVDVSDGAVDQDSLLDGEIQLQVLGLDERPPRAGERLLGLAQRLGRALLVLLGTFSCGGAPFRQRGLGFAIL